MRRDTKPRVTVRLTEEVTCCDRAERQRRRKTEQQSVAGGKERGKKLEERRQELVLPGPGASFCSQRLQSFQNNGGDRQSRLAKLLCGCYTTHNARSLLLTSKNSQIDWITSSISGDKINCVNVPKMISDDQISG